MSIGITDEHVELAASLRKWAAALGGVGSARAVEADPDARFADCWSAAGEMGVPTIGLPEAVGGGGGTPVDVAVALEACAPSSCRARCSARPSPRTCWPASTTSPPRSPRARWSSGSRSTRPSPPCGTPRRPPTCWSPTPTMPGASSPIADARLTAGLGLDLTRRFGAVALEQSDDVLAVPHLGPTWSDVRP